MCVCVQGGKKKKEKRGKQESRERVREFSFAQLHVKDFNVTHSSQSEESSFASGSTRFAHF